MLRRSSWLVLIGALAYAGAAAAQCEAKKLKIAGKYSFCRLKLESKMVKKGEPPDYFDCYDKYSYKWQLAEAAPGSCPSQGDEEALEAFITQHTDDLAVGLAGGPTPNCLDPAPPTFCPGVVLSTGQTTAYGTDSDGDLQKGASRSFTDNGDGTITDNATGLMWEKKSDDGSIHDKDNEYTWGTYRMDGTMVTSFLAALNGGGGFAGYTDWRIPNQFELESLVNLQNVNPAVDAAFNTSCAASCTVTTCSCTQSNGYWSSTTATSFAWFVSFDDGVIHSSGKTSTLYVRAVRGG
jgi:hypothetical protein